MKEISSTNEFHNVFSATQSDTVAALFWAEWAEGSKASIETLEALSEEYEDQVEFVSIDATKNAELSKHFDVAQLPSLLFFTKSDKNLLATLIAPTADIIVEAVEKIIEEGIMSLDGVEASDQKKISLNDIPMVKQEDPLEALNARLKKLINKTRMVLFMKGNRDAPQCGFSRTMVAALEKYDYSTFDILTDDSVRQGLKTYSDWPTFPQLYLDGELMGGLDICKEMITSGEFEDMKAPLKVDAVQAVQEPEKVEADGLTQSMKDKLAKIISSHNIMIFMKGDPTSPKCKFSKQLVPMMTEEGFPPGSYGHFNILEDEDVRASIKIYSEWPTFPQLYVKNELIGGIDIIKQMIEASEFQELFEDC
jgi:Grx4 family monothiol glutaredoxin